MENFSAQATAKSRQETVGEYKSAMIAIEERGNTMRRVSLSHTSESTLGYLFSKRFENIAEDGRLLTLELLVELGLLRLAIADCKGLLICLGIGEDSTSEQYSATDPKTLYFDVVTAIWFCLSHYENGAEFDRDTFDEFAHQLWNEIVEFDLEAWLQKRRAEDLTSGPEFEPTIISAVNLL